MKYEKELVSGKGRKKKKGRKRRTLMTGNDMSKNRLVRNRTVNWGKLLNGDEVRKVSWDQTGARWGA